MRTPSVDDLPGVRQRHPISQRPSCLSRITPPAQEVRGPVRVNARPLRVERESPVEVANGVGIVAHRAMDIGDGEGQLRRARVELQRPREVCRRLPDAP